MQAPLGPTRGEWRPDHIPRPSYRSSESMEPSELSPQSPKGRPIGYIKTEIASSRVPAARRPRAETPRSPTTVPATSPSATLPSRMSLARSSTASPQPQKKKGSLFGGLFAKEASSAALEQVAAQLIAQHGELSARAVPGVSSQKMPEFVPKVNSKWDGVPEAVKLKEKQEKERSRATRQEPGKPAARSTSADSRTRREQSSRSHERRNSNSTMSSFDSRGGAAERYQTQRSNTNYSSRTTSYMAQFPGEALPYGVRQAVSTKSESLRSPSGSSLPEITSYFPNNIPTPPAVPVRYKSGASMASENSSSTDRTKYDISSRHSEPGVDAVPEHSSSPLATPRERSPVTPPLPQPSNHSHGYEVPPAIRKHHDVMLVASGPNVLGPPAGTQRKPKLSPSVFLAGEARPLELPDDKGPKTVDLPLRRLNHGSPAPALSPVARVQQNLEDRPDSSRARLGLRASMLLRTDVAPWDRESQSAERDATSYPKHNSTRSADRLSMTTNARNMIPKGRFGKDRSER